MMMPPREQSMIVLEAKKALPNTKNIPANIRLKKIYGLLVDSN